MRDDVSEKIKKELKEIIKKLTDLDVEPVINPSAREEQGDYTTNIVIAIASSKFKVQSSKLGKKTTREVAEEIKREFDLLLNNKAYFDIAKIEVAGPGFINFWLSNNYFIRKLIPHLNPPPLEKGEETGGGSRNVQTQLRTIKSPKRFFVEYAQPNTHKAFHIGHLRNISIGESLARILEFLGHKVYRATYGSDIGLPVAKALFGIEELKIEYEKIKNKGSLKEKAEFLGLAYAKGAALYEESDRAKNKIDSINKELYEQNLHNYSSSEALAESRSSRQARTVRFNLSHNEKKSELLDLWQETRNWSIDYFRSIYNKLNTKFDKEFWESEVEEQGKKLVLDNLGSPREAGKVFTKDEEAVIFEGEKYGLHNRVFITSKGNPTYEGKEMGLAKLEEEAFPFDVSLHIVANEQTEYFKVVFKAMELIFPNLKDKKKHIAYGMVNLKGKKMSSRKGDVVGALDLIDKTKEKLKEVMKKSSLESDEKVLEKVAVGATKFSMLKYSASSNIVFDMDESVALDGDSGPYLQYAYARTCSILEKSEILNPKSETNLQFSIYNFQLEREERAILRHLEYFWQTVTKTADFYSPNILVDYLLELAKLYNLFYQKHRVLQSDKEEFRLALTAAVGKILKQGLYLLGIEAPERM